MTRALARELAALGFICCLVLHESPLFATHHRSYILFFHRQASLFSFVQSRLQWFLARLDPYSAYAIFLCNIFAHPYFRKMAPKRPFNGVVITQSPIIGSAMLTIPRSSSSTAEVHSCPPRLSRLIVTRPTGSLLTWMPRRRKTQTARLLQQTMTTSACRTLPRVRLVAILLLLLLPRQPPLSHAGHSEPIQHARPSRRQLHQPKTPPRPCLLVGPSEPTQHGRPSRR